MNLIIAGSEGFDNYQYLVAKLDKLLSNQNPEQVTVFSGCATTAVLGERYAQNHNIKIKRFPARWEDINIPGAQVQLKIPDNFKRAFNAKASQTRDELMVQSAVSDGIGALAFFWDGSSKDAGSILVLAKKYDLKVRLIKYLEDPLYGSMDQTKQAIAA